VKKTISYYLEIRRHFLLTEFAGVLAFARWDDRNEAIKPATIIRKKKKKKKK